MDKTIVVAIITGLCSGLIGGFFVKILDLRKERYLLREKWLNGFREKVNDWLRASEDFRLWIHWQGKNPEVTEKLNDVYIKGCAVRLMVRTEERDVSFSGDSIRNIESELDGLPRKIQDALDNLWTSQSTGAQVQVKVTDLQEEVIKKSKLIMMYNWKRIEEGLELLEIK